MLAAAPLGRLAQPLVAEEITLAICCLRPTAAGHRDLQLRVRKCRGNSGYRRGTIATGRATTEPADGERLEGRSPPATAVDQNGAPESAGFGAELANPATGLTFGKSAGRSAQCETRNVGR